jgi:hypothetical protein
MLSERQFVEECASARVVTDRNGAKAILVGGQVIELDAALFLKQELVEMIVTALRLSKWNQQ